ncbi:MAG: response regulator [Clostridiales bacterium]|jgi:YesN/AraC family two-component response regulator|nr:response regulator [Clostridiales bacterium]
MKVGGNMYEAYFVDDEPIILKSLLCNPVFKECGYEVVGFSTEPFEAEKDIARLLPDIVFTDLKMPELTGVELMERIRKKGIDCEFIIISAYDEFKATRRFFTLGGFDYLIKPVVAEELQEVLNRLTEKISDKKRRTAAARTQSPELNAITLYLKSNLTEKHTLESLGAKFHINHTYICDLFANHLGTTFTSYMTKLRMDTAEKFLTETQKNIKEIAWLCGYDYLHFVKTFKKHCGCTPTEFRLGGKS